jgi:hypothetical protein
MKRFIIPALLFAPMMASAQTLGNLETLLDSIGALVSLALPILVAIALLGFFWGLAKFIFAAGNEESKADGKRIMIWGIIALFVMVSVWGIVNFIGEALSIDQGDDLQGVPGVPIP